MGLHQHSGGPPQNVIATLNAGLRVEFNSREVAWVGKLLPLARISGNLTNSRAGFKLSRWPRWAVKALGTVHQLVTIVDRMQHVL